MVDEINEKNVVIEGKNRENEELLLNVLPAPIANRLRGGEKGIADGFAEVTVAFADLVGFTAMSSEMPPAEVVTLLNGLFSRFDEAAHELGIEKIKTVGDRLYGGLRACRCRSPITAARMVRMRSAWSHITREHAMEHKVSMKLRVGINSGPVVAGVIGKSKYIYDLWGDTVNLASRMESGACPTSIQVTRPVYENAEGPVRVRAARRDRGERQGQRRGVAAEDVGSAPCIRRDFAIIASKGAQGMTSGGRRRVLALFASLVAGLGATAPSSAQDAPSPAGGLNAPATARSWNAAPSSR
jgi:class 3 adenylate cyclase